MTQAKRAKKRPNSLITIAETMALVHRWGGELAESVDEELTEEREKREALEARVAKLEQPWWRRLVDSLRRAA